jgi:hypothetical protein
MDVVWLEPEEKLSSVIKIVTPRAVRGSRIGEGRTSDVTSQKLPNFVLKLRQETVELATALRFGITRKPEHLSKTIWVVL